MLPGMAKRSPHVPVDQQWLDACENWVTEQGLTYEKAGYALARKVGGSKRWGKAAMHRYLKGISTPWDLTVAFATVLGAPPPQPHSGAVNPWAEVGERLQRLSPGIHDELLRHAVAIADDLEAGR